MVTGHCGPNAYPALQTAGVQVYTGLAEGTVRDAVTKYHAGLLREAAGVDIQPHW